MKLPWKLAILLAAFMLLAACISTGPNDPPATAGTSLWGAIATFFRWVFGIAAPVATAAGEPWLGAIFGWLASTLTQHPVETVAIATPAVGLANHLLNGTPGTQRRKDIRDYRRSKRAAVSAVKKQHAVLRAERAHQRALAKHAEKKPVAA